MTKVIGVRFRTAGKVYFFDPLQFEIKRGDHVIVETARGIEFGTVVSGVHEVEEDKVIQPLKPVIRIDTLFDAMIRAGKKCANVTLKKVGAETCNVAYVIANVISDGSGVTGVILGDACLDLTNQVSANVSSLGVDTAADTGKESLSGCSHSECKHCGGDEHELLCSLDVNECIEDDPPKGDIKKSETNHSKTHYGTASESDLKS